MLKSLLLLSMRCSLAAAYPRLLLPHAAQPKEPTLEKTASQTMLKEGNSFTYTITLTFTHTTTGVIITDTLPSGIEFGAGGVTWTSNSLTNPNGGEWQC